MKISTKSRYALASLIILAENRNDDKNISILSISKQLDISKLYLEQIFSQLKRERLVVSEQGSQGGYRLAKTLNEITVGDIMRLFEINIFYKNNEEPANLNYIDKTLKLVIWDKLDQLLSQTLDKILLIDLVKEAEKQKINDNFMYYI